MKRSLWARSILLASLTLAAVPVAITAVPSTALADDKGDKTLAAIDTAVFKAKTQYLEYEATIKVQDKADRQVQLGIWMKGDSRYTEFLGPSDVKGTKVLILSPTQMYVYLPAYKKVRRIASHVTDQGFMGMNFTQDEMSIAAYSRMYTATVDSSDGKVTKLTLTAKKDSDAPYPKIQMTVDGKNLPSEIKYFSDSGAHIKTETRSNYTCEGDVCAPKELKMVDHTKSNASTTLVRKAWKVNPDIPDSRFSKRALEEES
ncbi:MAG: outer membrane lipoprotein-sorting protein [Polyangiaceae bacterium]